MEKFKLPAEIELKKRDSNPYGYDSKLYSIFDNSFDYGFVSGKKFVANNILRELHKQGWKKQDIKAFIALVCDYPQLLDETRPRLTDIK